MMKMKMLAVGEAVDQRCQAARKQCLPTVTLTFPTMKWTEIIPQPPTRFHPVAV
jgi:hypothetical protein